MTVEHAEASPDFARRCRLLGCANALKHTQLRHRRFKLDETQCVDLTYGEGTDDRIVKCMRVVGMR